MSVPLPAFRYHPDPLVTGAIEASDVECVCCRRRRGFIYRGLVYGAHDLHDSLCPWCIADGSVAPRLDARFADDHPLRKAKLAKHIVEEVSLRTPACHSWEQEQWYAHRDDACAFHGDASIEEVANSTEATKLAWREEFGLTEEDRTLATRNYRPRGAQTFYKFVCLHCDTIVLGWDFA